MPNDTAPRIELFDRHACCTLIGGEARPVHPATLYRLIRAGKWPAPVRIGGLARWRSDQCEAARAVLIGAEAA